MTPHPHRQASRIFGNLKLKMPRRRRGLKAGSAAASMAPPSSSCPPLGLGEGEPRPREPRAAALARPSDGSASGRRRPPPPPGASAVCCADWLGYTGEILVLFETPTGFAIFNYDGIQLFLPKAIEDIWVNFARDYMAENVVKLREFQTFKDKSSAIKLDTGVGYQLARMIQKWLRPGQKLAVGKREYKTCIEASLKISCLFNDAVMELMWGLRNQMKSLVPEEKFQWTKEDYPLMSRGMMIVLRRHHCYLKPEMVNIQIIETAHALYECDLCEEKHARSLQVATDLIKEVSDIDFKGWDPLKRVSALKIICYPEEKCDSKMFSDDERSKLLAVAPILEGKFYENTCLEIYDEIVWACGVRDKAQKLLKSWVKLARESCTAEGEQADFGG